MPAVRSVVLHGYQYSVYRRIARLVLEEKGVAYDMVEVNPFASLSASYLTLHPFGRVPSLVDDGFVVYETAAIARYVDRAFTGPALQPPAPQALARMDQLIAVVDAYAYWPLVRQVFAQRVFRGRAGTLVDEAEIARGLEAAPRVLGALEALASGGPFLVGDRLTLADLHLAPMIAYFVAAPEGHALLGSYTKLLPWWLAMQDRPSFEATDPGLPEAPRGA